MNKFLTIIAALLLISGFATADVYTEAATDGTLDLPWAFNQWAHAVGDTIGVADSTGSAWGSHVIVYGDSGYTGMAHVADLVVQNYVIEADVYLVGEVSATFPLYTGISIRTAHDEGQYYRMVFRNSGSSAHGQIRLQGYDGASWHISQYWEAGVDFDSLKTGWHNFKVKVMGAKFWAYIDGVELPGCPYEDPSPFLSEGYPGVYKYNTGYGETVFDNFKVTTSDLFISEYLEGTNSNKALEIYNPTGQAVDLGMYRYERANNGAATLSDSLEFPAGMMLEAGGVYVVGNPSAWDEVLDVSDTTHTITFYNGDDYIALAKKVEDAWVTLDVIGVLGVDPGSAWDVAGVPGATNEQTLVRKDSEIMGSTDWAASAGTDSANSQWLVMDQNTFTYLGEHPGEYVAPPINVTFNVNSSTVEGFSDSTEVIQIRGGIQDVGGDGSVWDQTLLKWSNESVEAPNVGGDYWQVTIVFPDSFVGKEVNWKVGATRTDDLGIVSDFWEDGSNRIFVVPEMDTVLGMGYVSSGFTPPYTPSENVDVYFRVNMAADVQFNPATTSIYMVGAFPGPDGADNMWVPDKYPLTRESGTSDYWGIHLPLATDGAPYDSTMYRFTQGTWESSENVRGQGMFPDNENRGISIGTNDTTISWVWYNNIAPVGPAGEDTVQVKFTADMTRAIQEKGFTPGDSLEVRWGHEASAVFATSALINVFGTDRYSATVDAENVELGENLVYQYYIIPEGRDEAREVYYDYNDPNQSTQERRKIVIPSPKPTEPFEINDDVDSQLDPRRMPIFPNSSPISSDVTVSWEVDLRPAYYQVKFGGDTLTDIQGETHIGPEQMDSIFVWGVWMNGPAVGGWGNPGGDWNIGLRENLDKKLYDDGTNGDTQAGDSIYTRQVMYYADPDSNDVVGQVYKFGIYGGDNESGTGGYGNNHVANIDDSQPNTTIHTQFGSINPPFYSHWDFDNNMPTAVEDINEAIVIRDPNLRENYPNPFNPTTTLTFELPKQMKVQLVVYDVLGQKVIELINGVQKQGTHKVVWNGANSRGRPVSSGVYFYRMITDNYVKTLKMTLMR